MGRSPVKNIDMEGRGKYGRSILRWCDQFDRVYDLNNFVHKYGEGIITSYSSERYFSVTSLDGFVMEYSSSLREIAGPSLVCLPLPFDPQNPSRGLWGMVEGIGKYLCLNQGAIEYRFSVEREGLHTEAKHYFADTPELALLKCLAHQWDIEMMEAEK